MLEDILPRIFQASDFRLYLVVERGEAFPHLRGSAVRDCPGGAQAEAGALRTRLGANSPTLRFSQEFY